MKCLSFALVLFWIILVIVVHRDSLKNVWNNTLMCYRKTSSLDSLKTDKIGRN